MVWILLALAIPGAFAHQTSMTVDGSPLYWPDPNVRLSIRTNTADLDSGTINSIVQNSMSEWNSTGAVNATTGATGNELKFSNDFATYGSAVIGVTEITYNAEGAISRASILLNDNYTFTADQSSFGTGSVYLGDVVTHEMGHFFGLSHSEVLNSSMFYTSFPGQSTISADDRSGLIQKYSGSQGSITGRVQGGNHIGVLGVHVQAFSKNTGQSVGTITDEDGNFIMKGLDLNDTYYIYTSPLKHIESLPGYFSNVQSEFCPGSYTGSFFSACGREFEGIPQGITLRSGSENVDVGVITINCGLKASEDYSYQKLQSNFAPVTIWDSSESDIREKAFVGYFTKRKDTNWSNWEGLVIDLSGVPAMANGLLNLKFVAHAFGNLLEYELRLLRNGHQDGVTKSISSDALLGTFSTDMEHTLLLSPAPSQNVFEVQVRARKLGSSYVPLTFPSPNQFTSDSHMPYLLMVNLLDNGTPLFNTSSYLSDNQTCLDAPYTYQVKKTKSSNENALTSSGSDQSAAGGGACGTIEPPKNGPPGSFPLVALGFALALLIGHLGKKSKNFLS